LGLRARLTNRNAGANTLPVRPGSDKTLATVGAIELPAVLATWFLARAFLTGRDARFGVSLAPLLLLVLLMTLTIAVMVLVPLCASFVTPGRLGLLSQARDERGGHGKAGDEPRQTAAGANRGKGLDEAVESASVHAAPWTRDHCAFHLYSGAHLCFDQDPCSAA
jgi:hypothetical protein